MIVAFVAQRCVLSQHLPTFHFLTLVSERGYGISLCKSEWNVSFPWKHMFYLCKPDEGYSLSIILILYPDSQAHKNAISHAQSPSHTHPHTHSYTFTHWFKVHSSFLPSKSDIMWQCYRPWMVPHSETVKCYYLVLCQWSVALWRTAGYTREGAWVKHVVIHWETSIIQSLTWAKCCVVLYLN